MTNPDMLHLSLLADHARWADFFLRLSLVVVDEAHVCRGVFGSHVAMVLRRLRRLVAHYGGAPSLVLASATVGNPGELADRPDRARVRRGGRGRRSPRGEKLFALWNPPIIDEETGARRSALTEASWLMARLVEEDVRTIGFTRSRRAAELLAEFTRREVPRASSATRIKAYRAGYLPEERRTHRAGARATASCWPSPPRTRSSSASTSARSTPRCSPAIRARARRCGSRPAAPGGASDDVARGAGRPGRSARPVPRAATREDLFDKPPEAAVIDPTNPYVLEPHLRCAAREQPLTRRRGSRFFGDGAAVTALGARWPSAASCVRRRDAGTTAGREDPHRAVDVRAGAGHVYSHRDRGDRRAARHRRRGPRVRHAASRRRLPASGRAVPRGAARPRRTRVGGRVSRPTPTTTRRRATSPTSRSSTCCERGTTGDVEHARSAPCA